MSNLYAGLEARDPMALDDAGDHYTKHVMAMTAEKLHSKADIAAELGYRDMRITELEAENTRLIEQLIAERVENQRLRSVILAVNPNTPFSVIEAQVLAEDE